MNFFISKSEQIYKIINIAFCMSFEFLNATLINSV